MFSKSKTQTHRGHRGVSDRVRGERPESEVGSAVDESPILHPEREALVNRVIHTCSIYERSPGLALSARESVELIVGRRETQRSASNQQIRIDARVVVRGEIQDQASGEVVDSGLNAERTGGQ